MWEFGACGVTLSEDNAALVTAAVCWHWILSLLAARHPPAAAAALQNGVRQEQAGATPCDDWQSAKTNTTSTLSMCPSIFLLGCQTTYGTMHTAVLIDKSGLERDSNSQRDREQAHRGIASWLQEDKEGPVLWVHARESEKSYFQPGLSPLRGCRAGDTGKIMWIMHTADLFLAHLPASEINRFHCQHHSQQCLNLPKSCFASRARGNQWDSLIVKV